MSRKIIELNGGLCGLPRLISGYFFFWMGSMCGCVLDISWMNFRDNSDVFLHSSLKLQLLDFMRCFLPWAEDLLLLFSLIGVEE